MKIKEIPNFLNAIKTLRNAADDETALASIFAFAEWKKDTDYSVGDRIRYGETLYRCIQSHTSQAEWIPELLPSLWAEISIEEWPEWHQPYGSEDAYHANDKVSHNGKHWVSTVDANIWEPGVYGWEEAT